MQQPDIENLAGLNSCCQEFLSGHTAAKQGTVVKCFECFSSFKLLFNMWRKVSTCLVQE